MKDQIKALHLQARKEKNKVASEVYEDLVNAIKNEEVKQNRSLTESELTAVIRRVSKQLSETADGHSKLDNIDALATVESQIELVEQLLPKQLTEQQVKDLILNATAELGITFEKKNMGSVVKLVVAASNGQTDGKTVSTIFQTLL